MKQLIVMALCVLPLVVLAPDGKEGCCRPLSATVRYTQPPSDVTNRDDCDVIRVRSVPVPVALTIRCPSGPIQELEGFLHYSELTTRDYGRHWVKELPLEPVPSPLSTSWVDLAQAPSDQNVLYRYIQEFGLYLRSENAGTTWYLPRYSIEGLSKEQFLAKWNRDGSFTTDFHLAAIDPKKPRRIFAGITLAPWASMINTVSGPVPVEPTPTNTIVKLDGVYVSNDAGDSWTKFSDVLKNSAPMGISYSNSRVIYGQSPNGIVKTEDGGGHWSLVGESGQLLKQPLGLTDRDPKYAQSTADFQLDISQFAVDPNNPDTVFLVSNKGLYRSLDGGQSWCLLDLGFDELGSVHSVAINSVKPTEVFVGTARGVFYSNDEGCHFQRIYSD